MPWFDDAVDRLTREPCCGYGVRGRPATEPTALAAMALLSAGHDEIVARAIQWLVGVQNANGSVGIDAALREPCWPTGWAVLAWQQSLNNVGWAEHVGWVKRSADPPSAPAEPRSPGATGGLSARASSALLDQPAAAPAALTAALTSSIQRAIAWMLSTRGELLAEQDTLAGAFGHNTRLRGWPWVEGTHSWVEPTAVQMLALRATGQADHPRCREAVRLLLDRQLPGGGWNYGNTTVLGNTLRPHIQPSGLALCALAAEPNVAIETAKAVSYLRSAISAETATASLCCALIGLTACNARPAEADLWLELAYQRSMARGGSAHEIALLVLAARGEIAGIENRT